MISTTNPKMKDARAAASRITRVSKNLQGLAVANWAKKIHDMLGTKPAARTSKLELVG